MKRIGHDSLTGILKVQRTFAFEKVWKLAGTNQLLQQPPKACILTICLIEQLKQSYTKALQFKPFCYIFKQILILKEIEYLKNAK